jgi:hypothetical protein
VFFATDKGYLMGLDIKTGKLAANPRLREVVQVAPYCVHVSAGSLDVDRFIHADAFHPYRRKTGKR